MIKRLIPSLTGAFAITFVLFLGMNFLIAPADAIRPEVKKHGPIIIGNVSPPTKPLTKIEKPERIDDPVEPIDYPKPTSSTDPDTITIGNNFGTPPPTRGPSGPRSIGLAEGDIQPIRKFAPAYPMNMQKHGIEGYVVVQFTVNKMGAVENVTIIESTNSGFNRATLKAVGQYKYKPRVVDGETLPVYGVMEKVSFQFEQS